MVPGMCNSAQTYIAGISCMHFELKDRSLLPSCDKQLRLPNTWLQKACTHKQDSTSAEEPCVKIKQDSMVASNLDYKCDSIDSLCSVQSTLSQIASPNTAHYFKTLCHELFPCVLFCYKRLSCASAVKEHCIYCPQLPCFSSPSFFFTFMCSCIFSISSYCQKYIGHSHRSEVLTRMHHLPLFRAKQT